MASQRLAATIERDGTAAIVHLEGDVAVATASALHGTLHALARRRGIDTVVLDFSGADRLDSAGIAVVTLLRRQLAQTGKQLELRQLDERQRAAFELLGHPTPIADQPIAAPRALQRLGAGVIGVASAARAMAQIAVDTVRQGLSVTPGSKRLTAGAFARQITEMGVDGLFVVGLMSFLLGMTIAFQGAVQLHRFGAGPFVADMVGVSLVRELVPLMTGVILTGRTGAAIAAELATMKVRSEIDALATMGIHPIRFLVVPRIAAITFVGPALTLIAMVIGGLGGMLVTSIVLDMPAAAFWARILERVELGDFAHGLAKSLVFAWIIGFAGCFYGLRAGADPSSVGHATTRTVVVGIFFIVVTDAAFATVTTLVGS